jgi:hypothetical protein
MSDSDIPLKPPVGGNGITSPYQQWDKSGHAVGYAGDPRLYAPNPQRRDKAFLGRYEEENAHRQSVESVGWDMQASSSEESIPNRLASPPGIGPLRTPDPFDSVETVHQMGYSPRMSPPPHVATAITPRVISPPPRTPTQAQYAQYVSARLPSPYDDDSSPIPPHQGPGPGGDASYGHGHAAEATDASYATAHSNFESDFDLDPPPRSPLLPPPTTTSPPPSNYRTAPGASLR